MDLSIFNESILNVNRIHEIEKEIGKEWDDKFELMARICEYFTYDFKIDKCGAIEIQDFISRKTSNKQSNFFYEEQNKEKQEAGHFVYKDINHMLVVWKPEILKVSHREILESKSLTFAPECVTLINSVEDSLPLELEYREMNVRDFNRIYSNEDHKNYQSLIKDLKRLGNLMGNHKLSNKVYEMNHGTKFLLLDNSALELKDNELMKFLIVYNFLWLRSFNFCKKLEGFPTSEFTGILGDEDNYSILMFEEDDDVLEILKYFTD